MSPCFMAFKGNQKENHEFGGEEISIWQRISLGTPSRVIGAHTCHFV